jgi:hypothetical protein
MFEALQGHFPILLASVGIIDEIPPLHVDRPPTLQVSRSRNLVPSTVSDTLTESDSSYYLQSWILGIPVDHQPLAGGDSTCWPIEGLLATGSNHEIVSTR